MNIIPKQSAILAILIRMLGSAYSGRSLPFSGLFEKKTGRTVLSQQTDGEQEWTLRGSRLLQGGRALLQAPGHSAYARPKMHKHNLQQGPKNVSGSAFKTKSRPTFGPDSGPDFGTGFRSRFRDRIPVPKSGPKSDPPKRFSTPCFSGLGAAF